MPPSTYTYAIDQSIAKHNQLRKYGFHGISYSFITRAVSSFLSKEKSAVNIVALHLGSGASACAIQGGKSFDTSMGLTPLAGLPGATRSGDIDPSLIFHYTHRAGYPSRSSTKDLHITEAEQILNKESGWKSLAGTTDFGVISQRYEQGEEDAKLAFEVFVDRLLGYIGSYYVKLGGEIDAIVFAGGIGERGAKLRSVVSEKLSCLGFEIDEGKNTKVGDTEDVVVDVGKDGAKHKILVCRTDEQLEMARNCIEALQNNDTSKA
jgi:acetate kinase